MVQGLFDETNLRNYTSKFKNFNLRDSVRSTSRMFFKMMTIFLFKNTKIPDNNNCTLEIGVGLRHPTVPVKSDIHLFNVH